MDQTKLIEHGHRFLYICSNLLALATPLTDVSPSSGHVGSEILDLLVSAWSLSITALVIGVIISLSAVSQLAHAIDRAIDRSRAQRLEGWLQKRVKRDQGLGLEEFKRTVRARRMKIDEVMAESMFKGADRDGNGTLTIEELAGLLKRVERVQKLSTAFTPILMQMRVQDELLMKMNSNIDRLLADNPQQIEVTVENV